MKRFVYTSSSFAATMPKPGKRFTVFANTFNNEAVEDALISDPDGATVYAASKVEAERSILKWIDENKPLLIVNRSKHVLSGTWLRLRPSNYRDLLTAAHCYSLSKCEYRFIDQLCQPGLSDLSPMGQSSLGFRLRFSSEYTPTTLCQCPR